MQAVVQQPGELLRRVAGREIRTAHVANEQGVAGEHRAGIRRAVQIGDQDADALQGVARRFEKAQTAAAEADLVALRHRNVRELRAGPRAHVDLGAGAGGQLAVPGNEIGMQVSLDDIRDAQVVFARGFQVDLDVALRIDDHRDAFGAGHIRSMRQTTEIELFEVHHHNYNRWMRRVGTVAMRRTDKSSSPMVCTDICAC